MQIWNLLSDPDSEFAFRSGFEICSQIQNLKFKVRSGSRLITLIKCTSSNKVEIANWLERHLVEAAIRKKSQANIDVQMAKNSFRALCANRISEWWDVTQWDQRFFKPHLME